MRPACPATMEVAACALVVPMQHTSALLSSLPRDAARKRGTVTHYVYYEDGRDCTLRAIHLAHTASHRLDLGEKLAAVLSTAAANAIAGSGARVCPGLRPLSAPCRLRAENEALLRWHATAKAASLHRCGAEAQGAEATAEPRFTFVELFAGIGGFRLGLSQIGGRCVFASEIDEGARAIYATNFGDEPLGDITAIDASDVPEHDILSAGFPCQPFAWCNTENQMRCTGAGLAEVRGVLFFEIPRVLRATRPRAFLLENVPNLLSFNGGTDFNTIESALRNEGYEVHHRVLTARSFGVPQERKRLYIVGLRSNLCRSALLSFAWPEPHSAPPSTLRSILEPNVSVPMDAWLSTKRWSRIVHRENGKATQPSGRGGRIARLDGYARTLGSSYRTSDRFSEFVPASEKAMPPRFYTRREVARLQGFPEDFVMDAEKSRRNCRDPGRWYHFAGNAVVPAVVAAIGDSIIRVLEASPDSKR